MKKILLLIFSFFFHSLTWSFTLSNSGRVKLPNPDVKIVVANNVCTTAGFNSAQEFASLIQESIDEYWNRIPTCALELEVEGVSSSIDTTSNTLGNALQQTPIGKILLGCSNSNTVFSSSDILGVASINTASGDRGAVLINNLNTSFANLSKQEKMATIAHEIGHAFGLGHSGDPAALMYYASGGKIQEKLNIDDYDACTYLYPHSAPGSCSALPIMKSFDDFPGNKSNGSSGKDLEKSLEQNISNPTFFNMLSVTVLLTFLTVLVGGVLKRFKLFFQ